MSCQTAAKRRGMMRSYDDCGRDPVELKLRDACPSCADKSHSPKGLVSTDRSVVAALLSTTPRPRARSSTDDFTPTHRRGGFLATRSRRTCPAKHHCRLPLWHNHGATRTGPKPCAARILSPPDGVGAQMDIVTAFWAGFCLRGVQS